MPNQVFWSIAFVVLSVQAAMVLCSQLFEVDPSWQQRALPFGESYYSQSFPSYGNAWSGYGSVGGGRFESRWPGYGGERVPSRSYFDDFEDGGEPRYGGASRMNRYGYFYGGPRYFPSHYDLPIAGYSSSRPRRLVGSGREHPSSPLWRWE